MDPLVTFAIALVAALLAWKLVKGVFKLLSLAAIVVVALVIYTGGIS